MPKILHSEEVQGWQANLGQKSKASGLAKLIHAFPLQAKTEEEGAYIQRDFINACNPAQ